VIYCLVPDATRTCWCYNYFNSVQVCPYIAMNLTMVMKLWVVFIFIFKLTATTGNYSFISLFVVWFHSLCHFATLISPKFTYHYTFCNILVGFFDVHVRRCLLCECVWQFFSLDPDVSFDPAEMNFSVCFSQLCQFPPYFSRRNTCMLLFLFLFSVCIYADRLVFCL
jgi:hypothetical protein